MNRNTILLIWLGGAVLAALLYVVGPQNVLAFYFDVLEALEAATRAIIDALTIRALDALRAVALALYVVFVVLAVMARRRGLRVGATLVVATILFLLLIGTSWYNHGMRWLIAAVLAGVGAVTMSARLLHPPPPGPPPRFRDPRDPWGMGGRGGPPGAPPPGA